MKTLSLASRHTPGPILVALVVTLTLPRVASAQALAGARADTAKIRWEGLWEPMNYPADVVMEDVAFVSADVGWIAGGQQDQTGGFILNTTDGGATWSVQLGDPESSERDYYALRFVDPTHGFAVQRTGGGDYKLVRTTDGESWTVSGTVPQHFGDYAFVSPTTGFAAHDRQILRTDDAGRTWRPVFTCRTKVQVQGLMRDAECDIAAFHFPSERVGYAIGNSSQADGLFVAKTEDGGQSWSVWKTLPGESGKEGHIFFTDESTGVACLIGGHMFRTSDGGHTWEQLAGPACEGKPALAFAGPEVGWFAAYQQVGWTTNGGKRWSGREFQLPTMITAFSLARSDRAYVVGDHGMIYRYSIVPDTTHVAPPAFTAPVMGIPIHGGS